MRGNFSIDPRQLYVDERLIGHCIYCGGQPDTRDYLPSRVLLDKPFPLNLPIVEACRSCNEGFSLDEEYLACLVECAICGSAKATGVKRPKVAAILRKHPPLAARLLQSCQVDKEGNKVWQPDLDRVRKVLLKLARGHMAFMLSLTQLPEPDVFYFGPLARMTPEECKNFESPSNSREMLLPEIGSRAFIEMWEAFVPKWVEWRVVQSGRYRYCISQSPEGDSVHFVLSEYLACRVVWF